MSDPSKLRSVSEKRRWVLICTVSLVIASLSLLFVRLGTEPLLDYDEAIYAQVIKNTQDAGQFLTLQGIGSPWFEKPPLYFWLAMGSERVLGKNEFALRLPSVLFALAALLLTCLIALELSGSVPAALLSGGILLSTGSFVEAARQLRLDVPVTAAILFSIYSFVRARKDPRWYAGIAVGIAIGFLLKSVIALFALIVIGFASLLQNDFQWLKQKYTWYGVALAIAIVVPWHWYEFSKFGKTFWEGYLGHAVFARFGSDVNGGGGNIEYLKYGSVLAFPWTFIFLAVFGWWVATKRAFKKNDRWILALALSAIAIGCVFLVAKTKLFYYLTPVFPLIALFLALLFYRLYERHATQKTGPLTVIVVGILLLLGLANTIYVAFHFQKELFINALVTKDERAIAEHLKMQPMEYDVRAFQYPYWDTLRYYSGRDIRLMKPDDTATTSFFMIMETYAYRQRPFPKEIMVRLEPVYVGNALSLLYFNTE